MPKAFVVFMFAWGITGLFAVLGSILGNAAGKTGLFAGAFLGGLIGLTGIVFMCTSLRWLPTAERTGALLGGTIGFTVAAPIAVTNLHTPVIPVAICSLVGVGVLLGAGFSRGRQRPRP